MVAIITGGVFLLNKSKEEPEETPVVEPIEASSDIAIGSPAPDFTLKNLDGDDVSLSDYKGKYVLLNFWTTWCGYCDLEMPDLQKFDDDNEDIVVLAIDVKEKEADVKDYISKNTYTFDVVLDSTGAVANKYLVSGFPTSYFIDEEGILLGGVPGAMDLDKMNELFNMIKEEN